MQLFSLFWERHQHHWNWIIFVAGLVVMLIAVWNHSLLLVLAGLCFFGVSFLKIPDVDPPFAFVDKCLKWERRWLAAKWNGRKVMRLIIFLLLVALLLFVVWKRSYISLIFFAGLGVNLWCVYADRVKGVRRF